MNSLALVTKLTIIALLGLGVFGRTVLPSEALEAPSPIAAEATIEGAPAAPTEAEPMGPMGPMAAMDPTREIAMPSTPELDHGHDHDHDSAEPEGPELDADDPTAYPRPAFGRVAFQREIDTLCVDRQARTTRLPLSSAMKGNSRTAIRNHGNLPAKHVLLSFDDGPRRPHTQILMDILRRCGIQAHFYVVGRGLNRGNNPALLRAMEAEGHVIGSHTMTHRLHLANESHEAARQEIMEGHLALEQVLGHETPFFRYPFMSVNRDPRTNEMFEEEGITHMIWNIALRDVSMRNPTDIRERGAHDVQRQGRGIVLGHDRKAVTVRALPGLLRELMDEDYTFVTLEADGDFRGASATN